MDEEKKSKDLNPFDDVHEEVFKFFGKLALYGIKSIFSIGRKKA